jgi:N-acetylneuraminic acid mutarotase
MPASRRLAAVAVLTVGLAGCSGKPSHPATSPTGTASPSRTAATATVSATPSSPTAVASLQSRTASLSLPAARYRTTGAAIGNDLYVLGGLDAAGAPSADVERVQPSASKVTLAGHLGTPTSGGAAVASGAKILLFGGAGAGSAPLNLVQVFDPATGTTAQAGVLPRPRTGAAATQVGNEIIVLGGFDATGAVPEILATADGSSFHVVGKLVTPVRAPAVAAVGTTVYVFGGVISGPDATGTFSPAVQSYNISTGLSKTVGTLPAPLAHARAVALGDQVYVLGGSTPGGPTAAIQRFDPRSGVLNPAGKLPGPVADAAAATIGSTSYLAGGIAAKPLTEIVTVTPSP